MPGHGGQDGDGTGPDGQGGDESSSGDGDEPGSPGPAGGTRPPRPGPGPARATPAAGTTRRADRHRQLHHPAHHLARPVRRPRRSHRIRYLDAAASRDLTTAITTTPGSRWCLTITSPGGHAIGHACARKEEPPPGPAPPGRPRTTRNRAPRHRAARPHRARAPPGGPGVRAPPGSGSLRWLTGLTINWLETGTCGHPRETSADQPPPALRHLLQTRDRTCSYPGCRRPATRCDDDHTTQ